MYLECILQSLLIYLSTRDYLGRSDVTEIAIFPVGEWGENIIQKKQDFTFFTRGCVFQCEGQTTLATHGLCEGVCAGW